MSDFAKAFYRMLFVLVAFTAIFVTLFGLHLKKSLEAGTLTIDGKLVSQKEPAQELDPALLGQVICTVSLRHVDDPSDEIFLDLPGDRPPILDLEVVVHGPIVNAHKIEGITRQLLRFFDRELKSRVPIVGRAYVDGEDGQLVYYQWRNGSWGLRSVNGNVFYLY